jgi:hypothetical protein
VPQFNGAGPGGVAEIATDGTVTRTWDFSAFGITSCSPTGLAVAASGRFMVGCGNGGTQSVLFDPRGAGTVVKTFSQVSGSDELWYDPTTGDFFVTGENNPGGPVFGVIDDATETWLENVATTTGNDHSIAVDPISGEVFVPFGADPANAVCSLGCIGVYAAVAAVPEPGALPMIAVALSGLAGLGFMRRGRGN